MVSPTSNTPHDPNAARILSRVGPLGAAGTTSLGSGVATGKLFQEELQRSRERNEDPREAEETIDEADARTAEIAVDRRQARRAQRHASFGVRGEAADAAPTDAADKGAGNLDGATAVGARAEDSSGLTPWAAQRASVPPSAEVGLGEPTSAHPRAQPDGPLPSGLESMSLGSEALPATAEAGLRSAPSGVSGSSASPAPNAALARPEAATLAFLAGARSRPTATSELARPSEAAPTPDPRLIEHASEVLRQIKLRLVPGAQRVSLELTPSELGRLSIQMSLRRGRLTGIVRAESADTLELLRSQAPELRALLTEQGLEPEELRFEHGFDALDDGRSLDFGSRGRDLAGDRLELPRSSARRFSPIHPAPEATPDSPALGLGEGHVDTYA